MPDYQYAHHSVGAGFYTKSLRADHGEYREPNLLRSLPEIPRNQYVHRSAQLGIERRSTSSRTIWIFHLNRNG